MEMATVLELEKPLVFSCGKLSKTGANSLGAFYMLNNCAELVDVVIRGNWPKVGYP